jgi:tRNA pseudouridine-54 N-methylase
MASINRAYRSDDPLHISLRDSMNGRWEVLCDRMREPLISVNSRKAAFEYAVLLAVAHPPTTIDFAS